MDAAEGEQHGPVVEPDRVLATYQHVRERWGLKNADTARMKAKRAGWPHLPKNNPSEVTRLVVPREQWDAIQKWARGTSQAVPEEQSREPAPGIIRGTGPLAAGAPLHPELAATLAAILGRLEGRETAELREARALADRQAAELAELREQVERDARELREVRELLSRREGELDGIKLATEHTHELLAQARREAAEAQTRATEASRRAEGADRAKRDAEEALGRLRGRGLVARLLNRG